MIRIDATNIWDAHNLAAYSDNSPTTAALLDLSSTGPATIDSNLIAPSDSSPVQFSDTTSYLNFIRNPDHPFVTNATLHVFSYASFANNGAGVTWIPFDMSGTDYHRVVTMVDPTTGLPRLIFGNDQGVWSVLDNNGTFETSDRELRRNCPGINRNGNLQITQFYYGAAQPSNVAAQIAGALFYGSAQDNGGPVSDPNILTRRQLRWAGPGGDADRRGAPTSRDRHGLPVLLALLLPQARTATDFFQYIGPGVSGAGYPYYLAGPSACSRPATACPLPTRSGRTGRRQLRRQPGQRQPAHDQLDHRADLRYREPGGDLVQIGDPSVFGSPGSFSVALAYGAPDPNAPEGVGNLGQLHVRGHGDRPDLRHPGRRRQRRRATTGLEHLANGLDGSAIQQIITDPTRGSHEAYAVTRNGVYWIADSILLANNPTNISDDWVNITGNSTTWPTRSSASPTTR